MVCMFEGFGRLKSFKVTQNDEENHVVITGRSGRKITIQFTLDFNFGLIRHMNGRDIAVKLTDETDGGVFVLPIAKEDGAVVIEAGLLNTPQHGGIQ